MMTFSRKLLQIVFDISFSKSVQFSSCLWGGGCHFVHMFEFSCKFPNIFKINVCNFLCDFLAFYRQFKNLFLQNCHVFSYKCIKDFFQNICHFLHDRISNFFLFHANLYIFFCKFPNDFFAKYFCTIMQMLIFGG